MLLFLRPPPPLPSRLACCRCRLNLKFARLASLSPPRVSSSSNNGEDVDTFTKYSGYLFQLSSSEADMLSDYNVSKIAAIYKKKPFVLLRRLFQTATTLGKWFALRFVDNLTDRAEEMFEVSIVNLWIWLCSNPWFWNCMIELLQICNPIYLLTITAH